MNKNVLTTAAVVAAMAVPATAQAHVTVQPGEAPAGGFTRLDVRVPNEEPDKGTVKVQVQMPPGFAFVSYEAIPGWTVEVKKTKLAKPIKTDDGEQTEQVSEITWTGDGKGTGIIKPGEFRDFGLSVGIPDKKPGTKLSFKALQTYQGGNVVRWIGPPDSEKPASQVTLTAAEDEHGGSHAKKEETADAAPASASTGGDTDDDGPSTALVIVALVLGALGLLTGGAALARGRSARTS